MLHRLYPHSLGRAFKCEAEMLLNASFVTIACFLLAVEPSGLYEGQSEKTLVRELHDLSASPILKQLMDTGACRNGTGFWTNLN